MIEYIFFKQLVECIQCFCNDDYDNIVMVMLNILYCLDLFGLKFLDLLCFLIKEVSDQEYLKKVMYD